MKLLRGIGWLIMLPLRLLRWSGQQAKQHKKITFFVLAVCGVCGFGVKVLKSSQQDDETHDREERARRADDDYEEPRGI